MADNALMADTSSYANPTGNKLLAAASNDPSQMIQNANGMMALQQRGVALNQQQFDLGVAKLKAIHDNAGAVVAMPTEDNALARIDDAQRQGAIGPDEAAREAAQIKSFGGDQSKIQQWAGGHQYSASDAATRLSAAYGQPITLNTGGEIQRGISKTGPDAGIYAQPGAAAIPTTLTPAERTTRIDFTDTGTGAKQSQSVGQLYDSQGNFITQQPGALQGAPASQPGYSPAPAPITFGGARSAAGAPQSTDAQGNSVGPDGKPLTLPANTPVRPASPPVSASGALTTGLSPGASETFKNSAGAWQGLASDVASPSGVNQRVFMLDQALGALRNTNTGLGTTARQHIQSYLAALPGGVGKWAAGDPTKLSDYDLANKYLTAYSLNTPGAARSDAGLNSAGAANASVNINPGAAQEVTLSNIGLERMKQAQANAFINSGQDPGTFSNWSVKWGQNVDPKAFALGSMTPAERTKLFSSLSGKARDNFRQSVRKGLDTGVLSPSDLQGAGDGQ